MTDNLSLGPDGHTNAVIEHIRTSDLGGALKADFAIEPGFEFHSDPALKLSGSYHSPMGRVLDLDLKVGSRDGRWAALHVAVPAADFEGKGVLGFAARLSAPQTCVARACLRSGTEDGFVDCFFDKHLFFRAEESSHLDALPVKLRDPIPVQAPWRELIFFLPTTDVRLSIIDLRLFIV